MHIIQTLYLNKGKDPFRDPFGWVAPEYHLMGWALSCLQLQKLYGNISLFADSPAVRLLIDTLQLPYSKVLHSHDQISLIHPDLWALPKIYTYSLQEQPFLHVDGDVFLFEPFKQELLNGELIAQNLEVATYHHYMITRNELMQHFTFLPTCVKNDFAHEIPFQAYNAGILGGNNVSFFHDYAETALDYVHKNADNLKHIHVNNFNVFFEQHLFSVLSNEKDIRVNVLFEGIIEDRGYRNMGDFHDVPFNRSYLHLLGHFKRDEPTCIQMASKLRELYPSYYDRIAAMFRDKNLRLSPCGFINGADISSTRTNEVENTHLQCLKFASKQCPPNIGTEAFQNDFDGFFSQLIIFLTNDLPISFLYERDLAAQHLYRDLCTTDKSAIFSQSLIRCSETDIIESVFNWSGFFKKYYRVGIDIYSKLPVLEGHYYHLAVPEASDNGFSLHDIDEVENLILQLLSNPLSVNDILLQMQSYFEEEVLLHHYDLYQNLILTSIKQLALKKAIQPFTMILKVE